MHQLMHHSNIQCHDVLRMSQEVFKQLCFTLNTRYGLKASYRVGVEEALGMSLKILAFNSTQRDIAEQFQRAQWTVTIKFEEVLDALCALHKDIVVWKPSDFNVPHQILRKDRRYYPYFGDCIGALDGTHVPVNVSGNGQGIYWNRKKEKSINVLAICDFDMRFIYTRIGVPGSAHDSKILTDCARHDKYFPFPPLGKFFVVDSGYVNRRGFLAPYRGEAYHPPDFGGRRPRTIQETFNKKHSSLRSVIERTFGVWKGKWKILKGPVRYSVEVQEKIFAATMALHNFIRDHQANDVDFAMARMTEEYSVDEIGDTEPVDDDEQITRLYDPTADEYMAGVRESIARDIWDTLR